MRGGGLGLAIFGVQLIEPGHGLGAHSRSAARRQQRIDGSGNARGQSGQRWHHVQSPVAQFDDIVSQRSQEGIRRLSQRFHPQQITVQYGDPGIQFASQPRQPIGTFFARRVGPTAHIAKLLHGADRQPQARHQFMAFRFAAQEPAQRIHRRGGGRIVAARLHQNGNGVP